MEYKFNPKVQKLKQMQALSLESKIVMSRQRIKEWHEHYEGSVYVSFSGGVDSTVLLHLVRSVFPDVKAVFCNTGLEYPQIVRFVHRTENVEIIRPKLTFKQVIEKYGYPVISKETATKIQEIRTTKSQKLLDLRLGKTEGRKMAELPQKYRYLIDAPFKISGECCSHLKKQPFARYNKTHKEFAYVGIMAEESLLRQESYIRYSCNAFEQKNPQSRPLMFWIRQDILKYITVRQYMGILSRTKIQVCLNLRVPTALDVLFVCLVFTWKNTLTDFSECRQKTPHYTTIV